MPNRLFNLNYDNYNVLMLEYYYYIIYYLMQLASGSFKNCLAFTKTCQYLYSAI